MLDVLSVKCFHEVVDVFLRCWSCNYVERREDRYWALPSLSIGWSNSNTYIQVYTMWVLYTWHKYIRHVHLTTPSNSRGINHWEFAKKMPEACDGMILGEEIDELLCRQNIWKREREREDKMDRHNDNQLRYAWSVHERPSSQLFWWQCVLKMYALKTIWDLFIWLLYNNWFVYMTIRLFMCMWPHVCMRSCLSLTIHKCSIKLLGNMI